MKRLTFICSHPMREGKSTYDNLRECFEDALDYSLKNPKVPVAIYVVLFGRNIGLTILKNGEEQLKKGD